MMVGNACIFGIGSYWYVRVLLYQMFQADVDSVTLEGEAWGGIIRIYKFV